MIKAHRVFLLACKWIRGTQKVFFRTNSESLIQEKMENQLFHPQETSVWRPLKCSIDPAKFFFQLSWKLIERWWKKNSSRISIIKKSQKRENSFSEKIISSHVNDESQIGHFSQVKPILKPWKPLKAIFKADNFYFFLYFTKKWKKKFIDLNLQFLQEFLIFKLSDVFFHVQSFDFFWAFGWQNSPLKVFKKNLIEADILFRLVSPNTLPEIPLIAYHSIQKKEFYLFGLELDEPRFLASI